MKVVTIEDARTRDQIRQLVERLACEYAGAVPVGQVIRATLRSANALYRLGARDARLLELADQATRRTLTDEIARHEPARPVAKAG
jgi:hypothetical protein